MESGALDQCNPELNGLTGFRKLLPHCQTTHAVIDQAVEMLQMPGAHRVLVLPYYANSAWLGRAPAQGS